MMMMLCSLLLIISRVVRELMGFRWHGIYR